jgi:hypothetical protein
MPAPEIDYFQRISRIVEHSVELPEESAVPSLIVAEQRAAELAQKIGEQVQVAKATGEP